MTLALMPDVDYVLWVFLASQTELTDLVSSRIYRAAIPADPVAPLVRLTRVGGDTIIGHPVALDEVRIQVDVYGGSQREANRIAETIRIICTDRLVNYQHEDGVLQSCYADPPFYQPDETWSTTSGAPRPRFILDLVITTRPPSPAA